MFKKLKGWFGKATNKKDSREKTKTELSNQALAAQLAADNSEVSVPAEAELLTSPATDEPVMALDANSATDHPVAVPEPEPAPPPPAVEPPADCIAIPGNIVLSLFPPEYLIAPVENLVADYGEQTGFIFSRSDLMYGLSAGRLTFSLADVVQKAQLNVFTDEIMEIYGQEIELPLVLVVPLIPPAWFVVGQQDQSKQQIVDEMTRKRCRSSPTASRWSVLTAENAFIPPIRPWGYRDVRRRPLGCPHHHRARRKQATPGRRGAREARVDQHQHRAMVGRQGQDGRLELSVQLATQGVVLGRLV